MITARFIIKGPRWAGIDSALHDGAFKWGLDLKTEVDKGLLVETVRGEVTGLPIHVEQFMETVEEGIDEWNE